LTQIEKDEITKEIEDNIVMAFKHKDRALLLHFTRIKQLLPKISYNDAIKMIDKLV